MQSLITKTKSKKIIWKYLDGNKTLCDAMGWLEHDVLFDVTHPTFDIENSFYFEADGTFVVLYVADNNPPEVYVLPYTFRNGRCITANEYGEYITRLSNIVKMQFPSADRFIEDFVFNKISME